MKPAITLPPPPLQFPMYIFGEDVAANFTELANEYSIPVDYVGTAALYAACSLMGNLYTSPIGAKGIIYCMLLGPSSIGKSKAVELVLNNVIANDAERLHAEFKHRDAEWNKTREQSRKSNEPFTDPKPQRCIRNATGGTIEALMKYASTSPAGFGVYFDEGRKLYKAGAHHKDNHSVDFWNNNWNGETIDDLLKDSDKETYVKKPAVSVLAGMQSSRVLEMFDKQAIESGLINRFLFTQSDYIKLNDNRDPFAQRSEAHPRWQSFIRELFDKGANFSFGYETAIQFTEDGKEAYRTVSNAITADSNARIANRKKGDVTDVLIGYIGKLYAYLGRFVHIIAVIENMHYPKVTAATVAKAVDVYNYFKENALALLTSIHNQAETNLNETQLKLFKVLPDVFSMEDAKAICAQLKLSEAYFPNNFKRVFEPKKYIRKDLATNKFYKI